MFYYLDNFRTALGCLQERYGDLLSAAERHFIEQFDALPQAAQALLVRLIMRKGELFREAKIAYAEIGCIAAAAEPLIDRRWLDANPALDLEELFRLLTRAELAAIFSGLRRGISKGEALEILRPLYGEPRTLENWTGQRTERVLRVSVANLCTQLRILFFGNFRQDWSEFVLADLQVFKYEAVDLSMQSRAFHSREEIEQFYVLYECRRQLFEEQALDDALASIPEQPFANEWLEARRVKLLFQIAREYERQQQPHEALKSYARCSHPGARLRRLLVMERIGDYATALELAEAAAAQPENEAERQQLPRVLGRICRRLALPAPPNTRLLKPLRLDVSLPQPQTPMSVERALLAHLATAEAPIYYVENTLVNSLFGLLCWEAIFAPIGGAFFHPFHSGPADLWSPAFYRRRQTLFERCLERLEDATYHAHIRQIFREKQDIQSPFVFWGALSAQLLETALHCMPALHLRRCCERLLLDLRENRAGLPDLIQFWPLERRYRMIEVKGPGDRLQDNQRRWLDYCHSVDIPVTVCHVRWAQVAA